jgi:predicted RNA binding protein YcfA (HicA-like mRNA interferase family)
LARLKPEPFREIKRKLEAAGFTEASQKGSHVKFVKRLPAEVIAAIVPRKQSVAVGTLHSILHQARITPGEWEAL